MCPYAAILLLPLCRTSSSLWWSPSFSFFFFILLHAQVVIATLLLPRCSSSFSSTSHAVVVLLFSFLFLHFLLHCGSSSSSSLCRFTPRRFRNVFVGDFAKIFNRSSSFFGLQPVSSRNLTFQFILCTLSGPHLFRVLLFSFHLLSVPPFDVL